jgi:hypothetical protein
MWLILSDLEFLAKEITDKEEMDESELCSASKRRDVVRVRRLFSQVAVKKMEYSDAQVARFLGVTTSAVNRLTNSKELPEVNRYI